MYIRLCKNVHSVTKRLRVGKSAIIWMLLCTKFRTGSLDHMRRRSNVVYAKNQQNND